MRKSEVNRMLGKMDELSEFATEMEIPFRSRRKCKSNRWSFQWI